MIKVLSFQQSEIDHFIQVKFCVTERYFTLFIKFWMCLVIKGSFLHWVKISLSHFKSFIIVLLSMATQKMFYLSSGNHSDESWIILLELLFSHNIFSSLSSVSHFPQLYLIWHNSPTLLHWTLGSYVFQIIYIFLKMKYKNQQGSDFFWP